MGCPIAQALPTNPEPQGVLHEPRCIPSVASSRQILLEIHPGCCCIRPDPGQRCFFNILDQANPPDTGSGAGLRTLPLGWLPSYRCCGPRNPIEHTCTVGWRINPSSF